MSGVAPHAVVTVVIGLPKIRSQGEPVCAVNLIIAVKG